MGDNKMIRPRLRNYTVVKRVITEYTFGSVTARTQGQAKLLAYHLPLSAAHNSEVVSTTVGVLREG